MSDHTNIEWTDATWNPITGCDIASPGCINCYAMDLAGTRLRNHSSRIGLTTRAANGKHVWNGMVRFNAQWLDQPMRWSKPRMVFVCAHGDLFHPSVPDDWIDKVFAVMARARHHTFQVLTKRASRMREYINAKYRAEAIATASHRIECCAMDSIPWPLPNVHLGVSAEDQERAAERIPDLLASNAAVRWLSLEPLIGHIDFYMVSEMWSLHGITPWLNQPILTGIHQVIVGGESGKRARPMHPEWARTIRDQCLSVGVPFFFKQWGEWEIASIANGHHGSLMPESDERYTWLGINGKTYNPSAPQAIDCYAMAKVGKKKSGRVLDGRTWDGYPSDLI